MRRRRLSPKIVGEVKLCPTCNLRWIESQLPKKPSYTRLPTTKTALRLCAEVRAYAKKIGEECVHFRGESLNGFLKRRKRRRK